MMNSKANYSSFTGLPYDKFIITMVERDTWETSLVHCYCCSCVLMTLRRSTCLLWCWCLICVYVCHCGLYLGSLTIPCTLSRAAYSLGITLAAFLCQAFLILPKIVLLVLNDCQCLKTLKSYVSMSYFAQ